MLFPAAVVLSLLAHGVLLLALLPGGRAVRVAAVGTESVEVRLTQTLPRTGAGPATPGTAAVAKVLVSTVAPEPAPRLLLTQRETPEAVTPSAEVSGGIMQDPSPVQGEPAPVGGEGGAAAVALAGVRGGLPSQGEFVPPAPQRAERPAYPTSARLHGWEGEVMLRVLVDANGGVSTIRVERSSGHAVLDQAASRAVSSWLFRPARSGLQAVTAEVRVPVQFRLAEL